MGRYSSGVRTVEGSQRIELSLLVRNNIFELNTCKKGVISWENGSNIYYVSESSSENRSLRLIYTIVSNRKEILIDYKIQLVTRVSNLGKGVVYFFACPKTGVLCRALIKCHGSPYFLSRQAYGKRIYYRSQLLSNNQYHINRAFHIEEQIESLIFISRKSHYKEKKTRLMKRIDGLIAKQEKHEDQQFFRLRKVILARDNQSKSLI